jgi:hypothetical protein
MPATDKAPSVTSEDRRVRTISVSVTCVRTVRVRSLGISRVSGTRSSPPDRRSAAERSDLAKHLITKRARSSAHRRRAALPAGVTCLRLPMPQASFFAFARSGDLNPDGALLRHLDTAAERQPYTVAVIAIDAVERCIDDAGDGVLRCHEITRTTTGRVAVSECHGVHGHAADIDGIVKRVTARKPPTREDGTANDG